MANELIKQETALEAVAAPNAQALEAVIAKGRLEDLNTEQRLQYIAAVCKSLDLNPLTRPLEIVNLQGKLTLYARKDCTDQLRKLHGVSIRIVDRQTVNGLHCVTARAQDRTGREDESMGAVVVDNLRGSDLANALMKAETKAKRRVTLSICGLGYVIDESELDTVPHAPPSFAEHAAERIREVAEQTGQPIPAVAEPVMDEAAKKKAEKRDFEYKQMIDSISGLKDQVGREAYYQVLGAHGFEHANEIRTRKEGVEIYKELNSILTMRQVEEQSEAARKAMEQPQ